FGFTSTFIEGVERAQCVVGEAVLAADSMKPSKLKRHLRTNHLALVGKDRDFFIRKMSELRGQQNTFLESASISARALLASYKVAHGIAQSKETHTVGEELILPAAINIVTAMLGEPSAEQIRSFPLSDNTVARRICDMSEDIEDQLLEKPTDNRFTLQVAEATDSAKDCHLITYFR
ncbi:unnamed protein product, partial [Ixodes hexagonus]